MNKKSNFKYWLAYTFLFIIFFIVVFHSFFLEKRSLVWESDGLGQYIVNLYSLYSRFYESISSVMYEGNLSLPIYSFHVGLGADIIGTYFISILEYIGAFFMRGNIENTYNLICVLKMYFSGLAFSWMARYFKRPYLSTLVGAFIYVFSGFTLYYGIRHQQFLMPLILLPCLIIAIDKIIKKKDAILFCILIFYSAWLDYYFLYMNTLIIGIYFVVVYLTSTEKKSLKEFCCISLRICGVYLIGIGMGFIPFMSKVQDFFNSPRTQSSTVKISELLTYGEKWIGNFISRLFAPYVQTDYLEYYMLFALMTLVLPAIILLFSVKNRAYFPLKIWTILGIIFFIFPIFGFVFSGFSSPINRWSYSFVLLSSFIVATILPTLGTIEKKKLIFPSLGGVIYIAICYLFKDPNDMSVIISAILMVVTVLSLSFFYYCTQRKKLIIAYVNIFILFGINLAINGEYIYSHKYGAFASEFVEQNKILTRFEDSLDVATSKIKDSSFYRTELFKNEQYTAGFSKVWQYNGTSLYASTINENIVEYNQDMENIGLLTVANLYNFDSRSFLEAINSVKYYIIESGQEGFVPYGFEYHSSCDVGERKIKIYENINVLPLGYTYSNYMPIDTYEKLTPIEKQEVMLQTAVTDTTDSIAEKIPEITSSEITYKASGKDVEIKDNRFIVKEDGATLDIIIDGDKNSEKYIEIKGLNIDDVTGKSLSIEISTNEIKKGIWVPNSSDLYRLNTNSYLINVGNFLGDKTTVHITFPYKGEYKFEEFRTYSQSTSNLKKYITDLKKNSLKNVNVSGNTITGTLSVETNKLLCFSIPYSTGWKLYIDKVETEIQKINKMYLGAEVSPGTHEIELHYSPIWIDTGKIITIVSIICFIMLVWNKRKSYLKRGGKINE